MIAQHMLDAIAISLVKAWTLSLGLLPVDNFDANDLNCVRDYGPHRVYTVQSRVAPSDKLDTEALKTALRLYLDAHNAHITAVRLYLYNMELYECPCGCGIFLFTSVYSD